MARSFHNRSGGWFGDYVPRRPTRLEPGRPEPDQPSQAQPDQPDQPEPDAAAIVIEPPPVRCPQCRSTNLKIYHTIQTDPVQRYRVCRDCGYKFKTIASR